MFELTDTLTYAVPVMLAVLVALTALLPREHDSSAAPAAGGLLLLVLAAVGWLLAGGLSAGAAVRTASWLAAGGSEPVLPPLYGWVAVLCGVLVLVVPLVLAGDAAWFRRRLVARERG